MNTPEVHVSHPSLQETSTSSLIQPVNLLALQDNRQYRTPDRPREIPRSNVINHPFSADASLLNSQHRSMLNNEYQPQYNQQNTSGEIQSYMDAQSTSDAPGLAFLPRNAPHSFAAPSPDHMLLRDRGHFATLQQQQHSLTYPGWTQSPFHHQSFSNQASYADTPPSTHASHQSHPQPHYQLPPPANSLGGLPSLITHQPELSFARVQPHYELRTNSQGLPPPNHGLSHPDFSGFSLEDKPYGERP